MPLVLAFSLTFAIMLTALLVASRPERRLDARMAARFAKIRGGGMLASGDEETFDALLKKTSKAGAGWLNHAVEQLSSALRLEALLLQAGSGMAPRRLLLLCAAAALGVSVLVFLVLQNPLLAVLLGASGAGLPIYYFRSRRDRRLAAFNKKLPDVIDAMSRSLRAGHSMTAALSIVAQEAAEPARTEFGEVFRQQKFGLPLREALLQLLDRVPSQDLRVLVTGILVQRDTGGNLTQILDRTARVIRDRVKLQGELRVHTAQGRMTGWVLCALPIIMLVLINLINPGYSKPLTDSEFGRKLIYGGLVLLCGGVFMIRRIVRSIEV